MLMSGLWRFPPYVVQIVERIGGGPVFEGRKLRWAIIVCDREYNLLFTSWLKRKPTPKQVQAFTFYTDVVGMDASDQRRRYWLYDDSCSPKNVPIGRLIPTVYERCHGSSACITSIGAANLSETTTSHWIFGNVAPDVKPNFHKSIGAI